LCDTEGAQLDGQKKPARPKAFNSMIKKTPSASEGAQAYLLGGFWCNVAPFDP
jgi:hypothetical protein